MILVNKNPLDAYQHKYKTILSQLMLIRDLKKIRNQFNTSHLMIKTYTYQIKNNPYKKLLLTANLPINTIKTNILRMVI